jgi:hypothetical protein
VDKISMLAGRGTLWLTKKQREFPCLPPQSQKKPKTAKNLLQIPACARALDAEPCQPFDGFSDGGSEKQGNRHLCRTRSPKALVERSRHLLGEEGISCNVRASEKPIQRVGGVLGRSVSQNHLSVSRGVLGGFLNRAKMVDHAELDLVIEN